MDVIVQIPLLEQHAKVSTSRLVLLATLVRFEHFIPCLEKVIIMKLLPPNVHKMRTSSCFKIREVVH